MITQFKYKVLDLLTRLKKSQQFDDETVVKVPLKVMECIKIVSDINNMERIQSIVNDDNTIDLFKEDIDASLKYYLDKINEEDHTELYILLKSLEAQIIGQYLYIKNLVPDQEHVTH